MGTEVTPRKSALRGVWPGIFFASLSIWLGSPRMRWTEGFWSDDVVSAAFRWFFTNLGIYFGFGILAYLVYVVEQRVKQGDPIKEDLNLALTVIGLVIGIVGFVPGWRERVFEFFTSPH